MHSQLEIKSKFKNYSVEIVNSIQNIIDLCNQSDTFVIVDKNISNLYSNFNDENIIKIECTENSKTLEGSSLLCSELLRKKITPYSKLVVIGGGILQDLAGFVASIYARGIEYILIPTTLLSMVDSCIGGKTSINFETKKNMLGTFFPPSKIIIYPKFTETLTSLDYISGLGEVYKFHILQNKIEQFDPNENITNMIYDSLQYKNYLITIDEFDKKERKFLNFGHTFGHAIESISSNIVPHGISVIIGSMIAARVSIKTGYSVPKINLILSKGIDLLKKSKIVFQNNWFDSDILIEFAKSDKKNNNQKINMVLLNNSDIFLLPIDNYKYIHESIKETYESI